MISRHDQSNRKFWVIAILSMVFGAGALAALEPAVLQFARNRSASLVRDASGVTPAEAQTDYHLATWLDRGNADAYLGLAKMQLASGRPDAALYSLSKAGQGSAQLQTKVRAFIESGRYPEAADAATQLADGSDDLRLAALADILAGRIADAGIHSQKLADPSSQSELSRAESSPVALAAALNDAGLTSAAVVTLKNQPSSFERDLLLARMYYQHHTQPDLNQAANLLQSAVTSAPSSVEARELLAKVFADEGNSRAATDQKNLVSRLKSGAL